MLTDIQYGFRKNHSTQSAALELIDRLMISMDKGQTPLAIFLDFSKAFDTLDYEILLYKLKYYGGYHVSDFKSLNDGLLLN